MDSMKERTKTMFADALLQMMETKELSAVRVVELCRLCGTDRQTFYYHFKDKYDLVTWIYQRDLKETFLSEHHMESKEQIIYFLQLLKKKQSFYSKAFQDMTQNSLFDYMHSANRKTTEELALEHTNGQPLTQEELFSIKFISYAWVSCISEWIQNKCQPAPEIFGDYLYTNSYFSHPLFLKSDKESGTE